jgi:hypothetical protein
VGYLPESNDVSTKAEEYPLLEAVAWERLMKKQQAGKRLSGCCGDFSIVEMSGGAAITGLSSHVYKWSINPRSNQKPRL